MIGVAAIVQKFHTFLATKGIRYLFHLRDITPFTKIGNALYYLVHITTLI